MSNLLYDDLFTRTPSNSEEYFLYVNSVKKTFNLEALKSFNFSVSKFFSIKTYDCFVVYCFNLLREWINKNEVYSERYLDGLEKVLNKLHLKRLLNVREEEYINHFKSVVFSKKRNLKRLIVDFPLIKLKIFNNDGLIEEKEEAVYFQFDNGFLIDGESYQQLLLGKIYLSNSRIIVTNDFFLASFPYQKIFSYKVSNGQFEFFYFGKKYIIVTEDNFVFHVSFERCKNIITKYYEI